MSEWLEMLKYVLPVAGMLIGWILKNRTPLPNEMVPLVLAAFGAILGYALPEIGIEIAVAWFTGGAVVLKELVAYGARKGK